MFRWAMKIATLHRIRIATIKFLIVKVLERKCLNYLDFFVGTQCIDISYKCRYL